MRERREQVLCASTLLVVLALSASHLADRYRPHAVPPARTAEAAALPRPAEVRLAPLPRPDGERDRPALAPPRELLPLEPVVLPDPPLPALSVRRPAPTPWLAGAAAHVDRIDPATLGGLDLGSEADAPQDPPAAPAATAMTNGAAAGVPDGDDGAAAPPEERFDWIVRGNTTSRVYGRILNDDPLGLPERPAEDLRFQMVSTRSGRPLGAAFDVPRDDVTALGFARTFENGYLAATRALGRGAGSASARKALALAMLGAAPDEPRALEFALAEASQAHAQAGSDPSTARLLAAVHAARHDLQGQLAVFRAALDGGWADAPLLCDHALAARELGLPERTAELLERARLLSRAAAEVPFVAGLLLADEGRHDEALSAFRTAATLSFSPPFEERQRQSLAVATGEALLALGEAEEAAHEARRVLQRDPAHVPALGLLAAAAAAQGELAQAAEVLQEALLLQPADGDLLVDAALVAWRRGEGPRALRLLQLARDADPVHAVAALLALGFLHEDAGLPSAAQEHYAAALERQPGHPEALYRMGRSQRLAGDAEAASATLSAALQLGGPDVLLLCELGCAALDRGAPSVAARTFREALRLAPDDAEVLWLLGSAHLLEGDLAGATEVLARAAAAGAPGAHAALGVAAWRRGRADDALAHFDEVAKAFAGRPDHPLARYAAAQAAAITDNLRKRQWVDLFTRTALQRGWTEHQWDGSPRVFLDGRAVQVQGRMEKPRDDERPGIGRQVDGRGFVSVEAELSAEAGGDVRYGLSLTYRQVRGIEGRLPKASLSVWVDGDGVVRVSALDNFGTLVLQGEALPVPPVARGETVRLGIERLDDGTGTYGFLVDGRRVGEPVTLRSLRSFSNLFDLALWGEAPPGRSASVSLHLCRVVRVP